MSQPPYPPPHPGPQGPYPPRGPYPPQGQAPYPAPGPYPPQGPPPPGYGPRRPGGGKPNRTPVIAIVAVVAVLLLGGGVWYLTQGGPGGGGSSSAGATDLSALPEAKVAQTRFPDLSALGFAPGSKKLCDGLAKPMTDRRYIKSGAYLQGLGLNCHYLTSGMSLLKDRAPSIHVLFFAWRSATPQDSEELLRRRLDEKADQNKRLGAKDRQVRLERVRIGAGGFVQYLGDKERSDTSFYFRSGRDLLSLQLTGAVHRQSGTGDSRPGEPLSQETAYAEAGDILKTVTGAGGAGEPRIADSGMKENARLADAKTPALATKGLGTASPPPDSLDKVCEAFAGVQRLRAKLRSSQGGNAGDTPQWTCVYESEKDYKRGGRPYLQAIVYVREFGANSPGVTAGSEHGRELQSAMRRTEGEGELYRLPAGTDGYAITHASDSSSRLYAGFIIDPTTQVRIELNGWRAGDGIEPLPEKSMLEALTAVLGGG